MSAAWKQRTASRFETYKAHGTSIRTIRFIQPGSKHKLTPSPVIKPRTHLPTPFLPVYLTRVASLKMGRMIDMAIKPTTEPMRMIVIGSIIEVMVLITSRNCLA